VNIERFWIESPDFTYGRKLVVLAADHDRYVASLEQQNRVLADQLKVEKERSAEWEKSARLARQQRGMVRVVK